jgi:mono/diheme cytochrome c family protein
MSEHSPNPESHDSAGGEMGPSADIPAEMPLPPLPRPPFWLMAGFLVMVVITWVPLAVIARARVSRSEEPRIHILQDMGTQPKYREQQTSEVFADGRADRSRVPGTVARGMLEDDDHYNRGFTRTETAGKGTVTFYDDFPSQVKVDHSLLERGQQRFNIYCNVCHGYDGQGMGPVHLRALELNNITLGMGEAALTANWIPPANLTSDAVRARANGHLFNTITNGIRSMPSYSTQIPVADRWAIVAYIRALQTAQNAPFSAVPEEKRNSLVTH